MAAPTVMTEKVLDKLEEAFSLGCGDVEACLHAGIARNTLLSYQNENPDFLHRKEELKERVVLLARMELIKGMKGNPEIALKFLERVKPKEFGKKIDIGVTGKVEVEAYRSDLKKLITELGNYGSRKEIDSGAVEGELVASDSLGGSRGEPEDSTTPAEEF